MQRGIACLEFRADLSEIPDMHSTHRVSIGIDPGLRKYLRGLRWHFKSAKLIQIADRYKIGPWPQDLYWLRKSAHVWNFRSSCLEFRVKDWSEFPVNFSSFAAADFPLRVTLRFTPFHSCGASDRSLALPPTRDALRCPLPRLKELRSSSY